DALVPVTVVDHEAARVARREVGDGLDREAVERARTAGVFGDRLLAVVAIEERQAVGIHEGDRFFVEDRDLLNVAANARELFAFGIAQHSLSAFDQPKTRIDGRYRAHRAGDQMFRLAPRIGEDQMLIARERDVGRLCERIVVYRPELGAFDVGNLES